MAVWSSSTYRIWNFCLFHKNNFVGKLIQSELKTMMYQNQFENLCNQLVIKDLWSSILWSIPEKCLSKNKTIQWFSYMTMEKVYIPLWNTQPRWYCVRCVQWASYVANGGERLSISLSIMFPLALTCWNWSIMVCVKKQDYISTAP